MSYGIPKGIEGSNLEVEILITMKGNYGVIRVELKRKLISSWSFGLFEAMTEIKKKEVL